MEAKEFELLGLNKYEALAYETLVLAGKAGASQIARESGVPYGRIYDIIHSLVAKGLVTIIPEKTKKFMPAPPDTFDKLLAKQQEKLNNLKQEVKKLKTLYLPIAETPVEIVQGKRNFYKIIQKMPAAQQSDYTFRFTSEIRPNWVKQTRTRLQKGVDIKRLVKYDDNTKLNVQKWKKLAPKLKQRKFEFDNVAGEIVDNKAVFFTLPESNVTVLIRDKPFAKLMKKLFEAAWEKAEPV